MKIKGWLVWTLVGIGTLLGVLSIAWWQINSAVTEDEQAMTRSEDDVPPQFAYRKVVGGLVSPVDIANTNIPDDTRLFIVEQAGKIRIIDDAKLIEQPFLDITNKVASDDEKGLLGLAFHPEYKDNSLFYVNYTTKQNGKLKTVIAEGSLMGNNFNKAESSLRTVIEFNQPFDNHNAGDLAFGPDGFLYIPTGDGGGKDGGDPQNKAQDLTSLLGKILRINPLETPQNSYSIPEDNPFVGQLGRDEIWSYGWRNPWRISFDKNTGDMFVGDVGQDVYEEINREAAGNPGLNYGWNCLEGDQKFKPQNCQDNINYAGPFTFYGHEGNDCSGSVTGGFVYRGKQFSNLDGYYIYADLCKNRLYAANVETGAAPFVSDSGEIKISSFGQDSQYELYLADISTGDIYQLISQ